MTLTLELPPQVEQAYRALAQARGVSLDAVVREILITAQPAGLTGPPERMSTEAWFAQFEQWADSFPESPLIPDEALRRENLYPDR